MASRVLVPHRYSVFFNQLPRSSVKFHPKFRQKSYWHGLGSRPLLSSTTYDVLKKSADAKGASPAVVSCHQGIEVDYSTFKKDVDTLAAGLAAFKYSVGTMAGILAPNIYEWMVVQYATAKLGWVLVNLNPAIQAPELEYALNLARCELLIVSDEFSVQNFHSILQVLIPDLDVSSPGQIESSRVPQLKTIINIGSEQKSGCIRYTDVLASATAALENLADQVNSSLDMDSIVNVQFTSGTTGKPKAVPLTHHNIVNNASTLGHWSGIAEDSHAAICLNVPLIHCFGCVIGSLNSVIHGAKIVLPAPRFNAKAALSAISKHKCTIVYGTPTMYVDMLSELTPDHKLDSLSTGLMSGSPCPPLLQRKVADRMGIKTLHIAYGATELSPVTTFTRPDSLMKRPDTVGQPIDHTEVKVVDKTGKVVPFGVRGELCSRGYHVFGGYLNEPERSAEILKDGWYHSGDEATMHEDGLITITGRIKDMIIRGGENIYPTEIEDHLLKMPGVTEVNVCGVPDGRLGEEVCAWIKVTAGHSIAEEDVRKFCKGQLSHYKIPRYVVFVDSFPKTLSGKIQKHVMRQEMCRRLAVNDRF
ncbi:uncharacterized protein LOC100906319 [Galendromus occidentalis]|uniref:Medium-chain acyl-CoA ligase ACSF2, mitochondrial n=1 Tax=Galendromus occidentalis TaxID=34638 RepID=A0AAJ6QY83_9ACAR|nr:uncharacterized protein LOC100906319 [Galendromus occidentalis]